MFITGGSGLTGPAVVGELIAAGHTVTGLARSDAAAARLQALGAAALRGSLQDLDCLAAGAESSDGVIHMAFGADRTDPGDRIPGERAALALAFAERGVRVSIVRLAPTVHGPGDHGFVPAFVAAARKTGVSAYIGDGGNRWPAVHRLDAASLYRLALENAPAGTALHGAAEGRVTLRSIADQIGRQLGVPSESLTIDEAREHFEHASEPFGSAFLAAAIVHTESVGRSVRSRQ